jgi:predicted ATPase
MLTSLTGGKALPADVVEQVLAKTDGVPLFVEELVKMILESGLVREDTGHYGLAGPLPPLAIPSTLHDSLMARLDRLSTARDLAQLGAVLGRECSYEFLQEIPQAQQQAEKVRTLATEHGFTQFMALRTMMQGWVRLTQGHAAEGIAQLREGLDAYRAKGTEMDLPYHLTRLAEAYYIQGQVEEGLTVLAEALALVDKNDERWWEAELHRLKGELLQQQVVPDAPQAETCFQQALAVARHQQAKSLELRAAMSLSRLWQRQGKRAEAHQLLAEIYGWFTEGFDTADLQEAKALLAELA